ncbi:hypothetical protein PGT21_004032 [Puccinia graminis f. sp. tritici]|uniref:Complexed with cef1p n=2 Tax=Puccinia graminis f. sp. tritici TaxID=56615 RepID=E3JVP0_PUCGT|nr:uncharacterized protein PGTG_02556 [Puccinia graminis f. sp. tritici CRL 75-36-700-3]EFP76115.2 hypothetical protein PGTG_02556 [Puccinia graminis f. sp. tritici CRL 75-36-700-3]KAA1104999.1 hypothetical protein PGTUg99_004201 [Puccinia graminis f. sp. tritici]KAA1117334.1 hypothetical protein PGT21_004032 [Puccinia graminis f. sp. tritici]
MSSAHRPTWTPAMGKDARMNTKQYSSRDIAAHTKLKYRQPGQNSKDDLARRDLKLELEMAERESAAKRRRAAGLLPINEENQANEKQSSTKLLEDGTDEESKAKRRKILEEALLADKDDSESDEDSDDDKRGSKRHGKGKATSVPLSSHNGSDNGRTNGKNDDEESDDDDDDDDDSDDDESETAELLRELEKIKRERAEEKERQERESNANAALDKEAEAAVGNPLLNLKAALNQNGLSPTNSVSTSSNSFFVKRRWDDDVIFKNQARDVNEKPKKEFVNDLLRTEFHRRFLKKFIA